MTFSNFTSPFTAGSFDRIRLVHDVALGVQDFKDAVGRGGGLSHLGDDEAEQRDREEQVHQVERELLPFAERQRAGDDLLAAHVQDRGLSEVGDQEDQREQEREQARDRDGLVHRVVGGGAEFGLLFLLAREGLDHLDARQVFLQDRVQGRKFLLHLREHRLG